MLDSPPRMKAVFELIRRAFRHEAPLHPVDRQMAKKWIKQRLAVVFPHLRNNPRELEKAYRTLGLEPREGQELGEDGTVFEVKLPGELPEP
jgi:hypothetical protein